MASDDQRIANSEKQNAWINIYTRMGNQTYRMQFSFLLIFDDEVANLHNWLQIRQLFIKSALV